jgi:hypothetical protein
MASTARQAEQVHPRADGHIGAYVRSVEVFDGKLSIVYYATDNLNGTLSTLSDKFIKKPIMVNAKLMSYFSIRNFIRYEVICAQPWLALMSPGNI